ncbi:MAG: EFR1 family ferrodoxin [Oscillospiraceae bacterium]|nr:EFR1 family ferrodoxin [Oscillospiraceae bacterium]
MVLYFSGTGNSRFAAQEIARLCEDELVSMNKAMRQRALDPYHAQYAFESAKPFVVVCPTYCWHVPRVVEDFLLDSRFLGSDRIYFFLTCGSGTGQARQNAEAIAKKLEMTFMGLGSARMPENYITLFHAPEADEAVGIIRAAISMMESTAGAISAGRCLTDSLAGPAIPEFVLNLFYRNFVHDRKFFVRDKCSGCGTCAALCPLANIRMKDRRPQWLGHCTQCQACIAVCPEDAIEFGRRSRKKRRYYLYADGRQKFPRDEEKQRVEL